MAEEMNNQMMQTSEQATNEDVIADEMINEMESMKKQISVEYAPFFKEMNWLKAISPNLEFKPFGTQKEEG
jgi:hypothetical protein